MQCVRRFYTQNTSSCSGLQWFFLSLSAGTWVTFGGQISDEVGHSGLIQWRNKCPKDWTKCLNYLTHKKSTWSNSLISQVIKYMQSCSLNVVMYCCVRTQLTFWRTDSFKANRQNLTLCSSIVKKDFCSQKHPVAQPFKCTDLNPLYTWLPTLSCSEVATGPS